MNKLYSVHDHWTDINKKNDVDIESIDGVITGIKVNGEDYGGGGESDLSTAQVTIIGNKDSANGWYLPVISDGTYKIEELWDGVYTVPLYKGSFFMMDKHSIGSTESVSGDIEEITSGKDSYFRIYGDCTVTLS